MTRQELINKITEIKEAFKHSFAPTNSIVSGVTLTLGQREYIDKAVNVFNQLDGNTPTIKNEDELIEEIRKTLGELLKKNDRAERPYKNQTLANWAYQGTKAIAKYAPLNEDCPISHGYVSEDRAFYSKEGYKFDIEALLEHIKHRGYQNPRTESKFHLLEQDDIERIERFYKLIVQSKLSADQATKLTRLQIKNLKEEIVSFYSGSLNDGPITLETLIINDKLTVDQAKDLSSNQIENLKKFVDKHATNPYRYIVSIHDQPFLKFPSKIYQLIINQKLSADQIRELTPDQGNNLDNLINRGKLEDNDLPSLSPQKIKDIASTHISRLIIHGKLDVDQVRKLTKPQIANLQGSELCQLIIKNKLTVDQATKKFTKQQIANLNDAILYRLIIENKLTVDQAKNLSPHQGNNLDNLINRGKLEDNDLPSLSPQHINNITSENISRLINYSKLDVDKACNLSEQKKEFLTHASYQTTNLIIRGKLTLDDLPKLTDNQVELLKNSNIAELILYEHLTVEGLDDLTDQQKFILLRYASIDGGEPYFIERHKLNCDDSTIIYDADISGINIHDLIIEEHLKVKDLNKANDLGVKILSQGFTRLHLIPDRFIKAEDLLQLNKDQARMLMDDGILFIIINKIVTWDEIRDLNYKQASLLPKEHIYPAVNEGNLKIIDFKDLTEKQIKNLEYKAIGLYLMRELLDLETAKDLADDEREEFIVQILGDEIDKMFSRDKSFGLGISSEDVMARTHIQRAIRSQALEDALKEFQMENDRRSSWSISNDKKLSINDKIEKFVNLKLEKYNLSNKQHAHHRKSVAIANLFCDMVEQMATDTSSQPRWSKTLDNFYKIICAKIMNEIPADQQQDFTNDLVIIRSQLDYLKQNHEQNKTWLSDPNISGLIDKLKQQFNKSYPQGIISVPLNNSTLADVFNRKQRNKDPQQSVENMVEQKTVQQLNYAKPIIEAISSTAFQNLLRNFQTEHLSNNRCNDSNSHSNSHYSLFNPQPVGIKNKDISESINALIDHREFQTDQTRPHTENGKLEISNDKLEVVDRFWDVIQAMAKKRRSSEEDYGWTNTLNNFYKKLKDDPDSSELRTIKQQLDYIKNGPKDTSQPFVADNNISDRIEKLKQQTSLLRDQEASHEHGGAPYACPQC